MGPGCYLTDRFQYVKISLVLSDTRKNLNFHDSLSFGQSYSCYYLKIRQSIYNTHTIQSDFAMPEIHPFLPSIFQSTFYFGSSFACDAPKNVGWIQHQESHFLLDPTLETTWIQRWNLVKIRSDFAIYFGWIHMLKSIWSIVDFLSWHFWLGNLEVLLYYFCLRTPSC